MAGFQGRAAAAGLLLFAAMRLLPPPDGLSAAGWAVAALAVLMAFYWVSEALPLALTATLPFILLPPMAVMPADEAASLYWSPIIFLFLGGAIVAMAVERHGLHRRLALAIASAAPASPRGLIGAFMAATAITSMGASNTATALIMMPVALALLQGRDGEGPAGGLVAGGLVAGGPGFATAMVLGIGWAATIGGFGTIVGSPTNAISAGIIRETLGVTIDFLTWAAFGIPLVLLAIPLTALLLIVGFRVPAGRTDRALIRDALGGGGPLSANQRRLLPFIALLLIGWIVLPLVRDDIGLGAVEDGTVAMLVALLLFVMPAQGGGALLDWKESGRLPWDIMLLFGGGLALAGAVTGSGLAGYIGEQMAGIGVLPPLAIAALVVLAVVIVTEFASNVATASGFMPVVVAVAAETGTAPLALAMAAAFAASWGFMMPAGTGPNAIAFATGRVSIGQMVRAGFVLDLLGVPLMVGVAFGVAALL